MSCSTLTRVALLVTLLCSVRSASAAAPDAITTNALQFERLPSSYIEIPLEMAVQTQPIFAAGGEPLPIFLNRFGGTYTSGWDDSSNNVSSIVNGGSATVSAFSGTNNQWAEVLSCVQDQFSAFNVVVTDLEPAGGAYIEAVLGGTPGQIGLPNGVGGVAPFDPYGCAILDQSIVYAFADVYLQSGWGGGTRALCETTVQEVAHAMSLDHVLICEDPMTYLSGCGEKTFQDEYGSCGENSPRACACERPTQNSVQVLLEKLGPSDGSPPPPPVEDNLAPLATITSPGDGANLLADSEVAITAEVSDETGLTSVQLFWANNDLWLACPGQGGGWSCEVAGDQYTWRVTPGVGTRSFYVQAQDVGGNTTTSNNVAITLSADGEAPMDPPAEEPPAEEPPADQMPPDVALVSPLQGAELQSQATIEVVVTASDDAGIAQVSLDWDYSDDNFPCPYNSGAVQCVVEGSTYTWTINVGDGERTFRARATDIAGNVVVTGDRTISLVANPAQPVENDGYEDNDTWDQATLTSCGDQLSLIAVAGDDDWFRINVPTDSGVRFEVTGAIADALSMSVRSGPFSGSVLADGTGAEVLELLPEIADLGVLITAPAGVSGAYGLNISCIDAGDISPPSDTDPNKDPIDPGDDDEGGPANGDGTSDDTVPGGNDDPSIGPGEGGAGSGCSASGTSTETPAGAGMLALLGMGFCLRRRHGSYFGPQG